MSKHTATIKEVAALAKVSQMTVSRVLNKQSSVKEATRNRVQAAIRELNYRPNLMARNLAGRSGQFIGLLYRNPSYGYLSEFLLGALSTCKQLGHYLIVEEPLAEADMMDLELIEKRFRDSSIQSLIVVPPLSDKPELIEMLKRTGISFVCVGPPVEGQEVHSVRMDDHSAAREMTDHLLELGHTRIGFIRGPSDHLSSELRFRGYQEALHYKGIGLNSQHVVSGDFTYASGMKAASDLLEQAEPVTAIFACNDDMAASAVSAAQRAKLRLPEDLSIVGFDDIPNVSWIWPPLTTIHQPIRDMAKQAIEILVDDQARQNPKPSIRSLDYELVIRQSSAPPKG